MATKHSILDTLGCALAGTACHEVRAITAMVAEWGGKPCSTLIGYGGLKVPPVGAVLGNCSAIHQYDFDDVHDLAPCHPTATSLMPALATAESRGGISGADLITAVACGSDITARVSKAILGTAHDHPWFRAPVVGLFGATVAAAKILGASRDQYLEALGLALPMVGGTFASLQHSGSSVRSIRDGLAFRNGVLAAELAMRGLRGDREVFDGPIGFYQSFYRGDYIRGELEADLGTRWETSRISLKPWPSIRHLHCSITATLQIIEAHDLAFDDIAEVTVDVGRINRNRFSDVPLGSIPSHRIDLLGNLRFAVAAAIYHRDLPLRLYRDTAMADALIVTALPRVNARYNKELDGNWTFEPAHVEIRTNNGQTFAADCRLALGHPENPMSEALKIAKFMQCAAAAARPLTETQSRQIISVVQNLESLRDVAELTRLLG